METYLDIFIPCDPRLHEIISAEAIEIGFDGAWEQEDGLRLYIPEGNFSPELLNELLNRYQINPNSYISNKVEDINWNEEWEKSYDPIYVNDVCVIRAEFHQPKEGIVYDIVIQPKMSFGTGHHDSTRMIVQLMLQLDFTNKSVLDVGCGTGVLAILAGMKGASSIVAIDNSPWSVENTLENAIRNKIVMEVIESDIENFEGGKFDCILSNITRNINHHNIPKYAKMMKPGGEFILSGFFERDFDFLNDQAIKHGFQLLNKAVSEKTWLALHYTFKG
jgi:ribosomal protein L11 methyltransferase